MGLNIVGKKRSAAQVLLEACFPGSSVVTLWRNRACHYYFTVSFGAAELN